jgi:glycosyltransferase involved in cell wall biosynthesis
MKISIITVCRNSELTIGKAVQSVLFQTYPDIEYIIIDGDSKDQTKEIIQKYMQGVACFISEPDEGIYQAMNKGIKLATGSFIQFLNSDDFLYDDRVVEDMVKFIEQYPDSDVVYGDSYIRPNIKISSNSFIARSPDPSKMPEVLIYGDIFLQGAIFFNSKIFSKLGYFNETYKISADYEFYTRFLENPDLKIRYYPRAIFSYSTEGISGSDVPATLKEMFTIQNQVSFYRNEPWQSIRVTHLQNSIIELNKSLFRALAESEKRGNRLKKLKNPVSALLLAFQYFKQKILDKKN